MPRSPGFLEPSVFITAAAPGCFPPSFFSALLFRETHGWGSKKCSGEDQLTPGATAGSAQCFLCVADHLRDICYWNKPILLLRDLFTELNCQNYVACCSYNLTSHRVPRNPVDGQTEERRHPNSLLRSQVWNEGGSALRRAKLTQKCKFPPSFSQKISR